MKSVTGIMILLAFTLSALAADDPSIRGERRRGIPGGHAGAHRPQHCGRALRHV